MDRLAEIEIVQRQSGLDDDDIAWLISEVKRLRERDMILTATARKAVTSFGDPYHETAVRYLGEYLGIA